MRKQHDWAGLALALGLCFAAPAHELAVDGDASDWTLPGPTLSNLGHVARNSNLDGTLIWRDGTGDAQTDLANPESEADLAELRVSGSVRDLAILMRFDDLTLASGAGAVQVQLAIDLDQVDASGQPDFDGGADLSVATPAQWEYLLVTQLGSGSAQVTVIDGALTRSQTGAVAVDVASDVIELSVPWSALGMTAPPAGAIRLSAAIFRADQNDTLLEVGAAGDADALDVVSNNNQPGVNQPTSNEVADQTLNYFLDIWFDASGEVRAPVLISAVLPRPASMVTAEYVEVFNTGTGAVDLLNFALGDEETPGATEGMFAFPGFVLAPGQRITVARSALAYAAGTGLTADFETEVSDPMVTTLNQDLAWGIGGLDLVDSGDQVLLIDAQRTVIDAIAYDSAFYIGVETLPPANAGETHYRAPRGTDRNLADDFRFNIADLAVTIAQAPTRIIEGTAVQYVIRLVNRGPHPVSDARVRLEQFSDLQMAGNSCQNVTSGSLCAALDSETLDALVTLAVDGSMELLLDATTGAGGGTAALNVTISVPDQVGELAPADNESAIATLILQDLLFRDSYESGL